MKHAGLILFGAGVAVVATIAFKSKAKAAPVFMPPAPPDPGADLLKGARDALADLPAGYTADRL